MEEVKSLEEVKILKEEVEVVVKILKEEVEVVEVAVTRARTWRWRPCACSTGGSD